MPIVVLLVLLLVSQPFAKGEPLIRPLGPFGGDVRSLTIDPINTNTLYAGTADGQIYKTENGGQQWTRLDPGIGRRKIIIDDLHILPNNPHIIYAGGWAVNYDGGGLFKTTDGGKGWQELPITEKSQAVTAVAIAQSDPNTLVVGTLEGVFRSDDGGATWRNISSSHKEVIHLESVAIDPLDPNIIYGGTWHLAYKTVDGGKSWHLVNAGMIEDSHVFTMSIDSKAPRTMFAGACSGIYKSTSAATRWEKLKNGLTFEDRRTRTSRIDPFNSNTIYIGTTRGLFISRDAGHSWKRMTDNDLTVNTIALDPTVKNVVYLGTEKAGILKSVDGGHTFAPINHGFIHRSIAAVQSDPAVKDRLYAGVVFGGKNGGVFRSEDGGITWRPMNGGLREPDRDVFALLVSERHNQTIFAGTSNGIYKSINGAGSWTKITTRDLETKVYDVKFLSPKETELIAATEKGLFKNSPGRWQRLPIPGHSGRVVSLALFKLDPKIIYAAGDRQIYSTKDGGKRWTSHQPPEGSIRTIEVDPQDSNLVFLGTTKGVYRSEDSGKTWEKPPQGVYEFEVSKILTSTKNPQEMWIADLVLGSILHSKDRGKSWHETNYGKHSGIWTLSLDPFNPTTIYAGTISDGVCKVGSATNPAESTRTLEVNE